MKKLYLLRHAKSSWEDSSLKDIDRPLNNRGKNQVKYMKEFVLKNNIKPDLILCSTSNRTKLTVNGIFDKKNCVFIDSLYHASSTEIMGIIKKVEKQIDSLMIIGHNPGLNEFAYGLINFENNIQTASLIEIDILIDDWKDFHKNDSKFVSYTNPPKKK
ncbi:MAG: phosphohistidine phosphatase [Arcobacter sp.]|uniref:SixA phosphatase family protein n=1 Tax=uncultured Arcobacter sp. TaxID=165434 RepID=UPI000CB06B59|nr:histidine phosphatase family protein [uncultured Arcobacter sp.]PLY10303.1 MAG: phosphohistidine phosphatase [Arcobacter sp.]